VIAQYTLIFLPILQAVKTDTYYLFYNLTSNPYETVDISKQFPEEKAWMIQRLNHALANRPPLLTKDNFDEETENSKRRQAMQMKGKLVQTPSLDWCAAV